MAYRYLILDSKDTAVARGTTEYAPRGHEWQMVIDDGDLEELAKHTYVRLVGNSDAVPAMEGKIIRREGNVVVLEPVRPLAEAQRKNLRIPVRFISYIYPRSGSWKGRVPIISNDLSCGGLGFFCPRPLEVGEQVQVVIPVTSQPLLLELEVLRCSEGPEEECLYAAKFLSLLREEENMLREAVFGLQLKRS